MEKGVGQDLGIVIVNVASGLIAARCEDVRDSSHDVRSKDGYKNDIFDEAQTKLATLRLGLQS